MTTPDVTAFQRSDLNAFLFADVGTEANGMTLSVVSVFARQGSDPWGEAGRLADLPKAEATDSLARTIAAMPRSLWDLPAAIAIAVRLTGLLPARPATATVLRVAGKLPSARAAVVLLCVAFAAAFGLSAMMRSTTPSRFDGSDVGSFSTLAPAPASNSAEGTH